MTQGKIKRDTFTIVVFAKNEERNIPFVIDSLFRKYAADKIVFVLDGNLEPTAGILSDKGIPFLRGDNKGKGSAIQKAIQHVQSDILVFMDADGSHNPEEIENLLDPLMKDEATMVIGSRFLGGSEELSGNIDNFIRNAGNVVTNHIVNSLWGRAKRNISDTHNGFRAIKRELFLGLDLTENGFAVEMEMVIKCLKKGYRVCEVPSFELKRRHGKSHIPIYHLFYYIRCFIRNMIG